MTGAPLRVVIVDDSSVVRGILARGLRAHGFEVVGAAADPFEARDLVLQHRPDVVTLDIEMPRMNGLTFLERLMAFQPMPVVILSSLTPRGGDMALRAMELGAVEVLCKPSHDFAFKPDSPAMSQLAGTLKVATKVKVRRRWSVGLKQKMSFDKRDGGPARRVLALGASTGGTQALPVLLSQRPPAGLGCVMVQHMPPGFTTSFANRLNELSPWKVREARHGDLLREGEALLAPGNRHLLIKRFESGWRVVLKDTPEVSFARPSVDVLFTSVAREAGADSIGVILTGMGRDGADGLLAMRKAGARTLAQDEESCAVFGMPREAILLGAAERVLPLETLTGAITTTVSRLQTEGSLV